MAENCENNTLLKRDGTSRDQRLLRALLPEFAAIDDRSLGDLIRFTQEFSKELKFFAYPAGAEEKDWSAFMAEESDPDLHVLMAEGEAGEEAWLKYVSAKKGYTQPQQALFMAFLKLFLIAVSDLNDITAKHLSYYFRDVLQIREKPALPDHVFLIFELAKHVRGSHSIQEGTLLKAGKDNSGKPLVYATSDELVVNRGKVASLKAVYRNLSGDGRLHAAAKADSSDGIEADPETADGSWKTFGGSHAPKAGIGFAVSSPGLQLSEGRRKITFRIVCTPESIQTLDDLAKIDPELIDDLFTVGLSGEEGWILPDSVAPDPDSEEEFLLEKEILQFMNSASAAEIMAKVKDDPTAGYSEDRPGYAIGQTVADAIVAYRQGGKRSFKKIADLRKVSYLGPDKVNDIQYTFRKKLSVTRVNPGAGVIILARSLDATKPPVTRQPDGVYETDYGSRWPVARILINQDAGFESGFPLELLEKIHIAKIDVAVDVDEVRSNVLANDSGNLDPAKPFMPFGNRPVRGANFYIGNTEILQSAPKKLSINLNWQNLPQVNFHKHYKKYKKYTGLSFSNDTFEADVELLQDRTWDGLYEDQKLFEDGELDKKEKPVPAPSRQINIPPGNLEAIRRNPEMEAVTGITSTVKDGFIRLRLGNRDFGHHVFGKVYAEAVLKDNGKKVPNEPYTPVIDELWLDYSAGFRMDFDEKSSDGYDRFFHIHSFGFSEPESESGQKGPALIPAHADEGALCIGIEEFTGGRNISILFQVSEGSADPDLPAQSLRWSYLSGSTWQPFDDRQILSDGTHELLTSGIISFGVPDNATTNHSLMPSGLLWIRCTAKKNSAALSDLISVKAQAVKAKFEDRDNDPDYLSEPLPAGSIARLKENDAAIKSVEQPFESDGGAVQEKPEAFWLRVSERLRHKNRAITIWDYERLVLENFPDVYKVKCLNHIRYTGVAEEYSEIAPGNVSLILVPATINRNTLDPLRPRASLLLLEQIDGFISELKPEAVKLWVRNPLYEEIKVKFEVKFHEGRDRGYYQEVLEKDIISFLSPWASKGSPNVVFGGRIHKSMIIHFIEKLPYVDFVTCFSMNHIINSPGGGKPVIHKDVREAEATTAASVLGSAPAHVIRVMDEPDCNCEDNLVEAFQERKTDDCGCGSQ